MGKRKYHRKRGKTSQRDWRDLVEQQQLRSAYVEFASAVNQAQELANARAPYAGAPASHIIDLREAGRILDEHPQLVSYLQGLQERNEALSAAKSLPFDMLSKASPTGSTPQSEDLGGWASDKNRPIGVPNARQLRDWADTDEWVKSAIDYYVQRVSRADIAILPNDERLPYNRTTEKALQLLLDQPNELGDSWPSLVAMGVRDYFILGRWMWSKNMTPKRQPAALYAEDAATIKVYSGWAGDPSQPHFLFDTGGIGSTKIPLRDDEVIYIPDGVSSYRLSYSRVQALRNAILSDLKATESAARMVDQKPPPHLVQIPGASETQIRTLRATYESDLMGRREILWLGGPNNAQVHPLVYSLKDQQWMEWMTYLAQKICAIFQITPQDIGFLEDVNRSTAGSQQEISENKGLIPTLLQLEEHFNRQLLADFAPRLPNGRTDLNKLNLRMVFPEVSEAARMMHVEKVIDTATKALAGLPVATLNQALAMIGQEPVSGGNSFFIKTATGAAPWLSYDNDFGGYTPPLTTSGELGAQDAEGGPSTDEESDDDIGDSSGNDNSQETPMSESPTNGGDNSTSNSNEDTQKRFMDMRKPGKAWNPPMMQSIEGSI